MGHCEGKCGHQLFLTAIKVWIIGGLEKVETFMHEVFQEVMQINVESFLQVNVVIKLFL